jgi:putative PIN family toxin of toxin-antitoxin system
MRVVLDTSVIVAALRSRSGASRLWLNAVLLGHHVTVVSVALMIEYEAVLTRPEQLAAANLTERQVLKFLDGLSSVAIQTPTTNLWRPLLDDPDDEMVLEAAVQGGAELLLTFNVRDFVGSERFGIKAIQPGPAWQLTKGT